MNGADPAIDLVALVPGKDEQETFAALLQRHTQLGVRKVTFECLVHPRRDSGCFQEAEHVLRSYHRRARRALVLFDHFGSGRETDAAAQVEVEVEQRLRVNGWNDRAIAVVVEPELESWVWVDCDSVATALHWPGPSDLRTWLEGQGLWRQEGGKPGEPKKALLSALRASRQRRSSALYRLLAGQLPIDGCRDRGFGRMRARLTEWFPPA